ncbi:MAG: type II toxin-antitoxin system RelE/ParE family toxin [Alphaproteobacteria bacterium]|nr:type II toxin-antitoxin system RelE/ParE family toxin [Alphaproteobacteria bacterium]
MGSVHAAVYSRDATRALRRAPRNLRDLIRSRVELLAVDPLAPNNNVKALAGRPGHRLRVGDWRVIYHLDHGLRILVVEKMAPRGRAYE